MKQDEFNEKVWNEYEKLKRRLKRILKFIVMFITLSGIISILSIIGSQLIHSYIY